MLFYVLLCPGGKKERENVYPQKRHRPYETHTGRTHPVQPHTGFLPVDLHTSVLLPFSGRLFGGLRLDGRWRCIGDCSCAQKLQKTPRQIHRHDDRGSKVPLDGYVLAFGPAKFPLSCDLLPQLKSDKLDGVEQSMASR